MSDWVLVGDEGELKSKQFSIVDLDGTSVAVIRFEDGYYAIEDVCTHDGSTMTDEKSIVGNEIVCPRHGARFSILTGEALSAPAWEGVATFEVKIEAEKVFVRDSRWD